VPGDVVLEIGAVGDVVIDVEVRIPGVEELEPRAHLRRIGLDVVAIEIEALHIGAETRGLGTVLRRAMVGREIFVAVDIEHTGMTTKIARSSQGANFLETVMSRTSMSTVSLPSISPAWIPLWMKITAFPVLAAASGVNARSLLTTSATIVRPSGVVPMSIT